MYNACAMLNNGWNTIQLQERERPTVLPEDLCAMAKELDPDDFDEPVQEFLKEVERGEASESVRRAATLLLQDEVDFSPELREAGVEPDEKLIAPLLAAGADVNTRNPYGEPPLHLAARYGYLEIAKMLVAAGARRDLPNARGELAVKLAARRELIDFLAPPEAHTEDLGHGCCCGHDHDRDHECHCDGEDGCCCDHHEH